MQPGQVRSGINLSGECVRQDLSDVGLTRAEKSAVQELSVPVSSSPDMSEVSGSEVIGAAPEGPVKRNGDERYGLALLSAAAAFLGEGAAFGFQKSGSALIQSEAT
jgi:hypothetical protein